MDTKNSHLQASSSVNSTTNSTGPDRVARSGQYSLVYVSNLPQFEDNFSFDQDLKVNEKDFLEEYKVEATEEVRRIASKYQIYSTNPYSTRLIEELFWTKRLEPEEVRRLQDAYMCYPDSVKKN